MSLTYVVTGASRGLGLEFVKQLSAKGHRVFALAHNPEQSVGLQQLIENHQDVISVQADIRCEKSIKEATEHVKNNAPEGVDVLINNAGISGDMKLTFDTTPKQVYMQVFETNVCGTMDMTRSLLPVLRLGGKEKTKKILNVSSILGSIGGMTQPTLPAISVSKAALNMVTRMMASRLSKENFIVISAHPGWVKTDFGGKSAPVEPADSIQGMLHVLDHLTAKENGSFIDFKGNKLKW